MSCHSWQRDVEVGIGLKALLLLVLLVWWLLLSQVSEVVDH
jgi:hypothetical protein